MSRDDSPNAEVAHGEGMVQNCRECGTPLPAGYLCDRCDTVEGWP